MSANYNALNQPNWMYGNARASGNSLNFGHDPLGRCVIRWDSLGSTYLYYDGWNLITEGSRFDQPIRQYIHGARVDEIVWSKVVTSGVVAYHHYDARTHCMMLTGMAQNIIEQYDYDAFGRVYAYNAAGAALTVGGRPGSPYGNRFLFTGREWLWDLGVYDYRHRHYNPELGRFLQPDPKHFGAGDYNLYRYCHNDPINRVDPTGLQEWMNEFVADAERSSGANLFQQRGANLFKGVNEGVQGGFRVGVEVGKEYVKIEAGGRLTEGALGAAGFVLKGLSKVEARAAVADLEVGTAQTAGALKAVNRATKEGVTSVSQTGADVVVQTARPGKNGIQVMESVVRPDGSKTVVQRAYDSDGKLVHVDIKR